MKIRYIKYWAFAAVLGMGTVSCEDFLNRPTEDNYNESNFYQNDEQCVQGVNYLYPKIRKQSQWQSQLQ
jgi:hypothetical protein